MNTENSLTELFDRYLERRLTLKETRDFEDRLKIDPDFSASFRLHKEIDFALLEQEIMFFRKELDKIHEEGYDEKLLKAPMMISPKEDTELDMAIKEEDVLSLRSQLDQIHAEIDFDISAEDIARYAEVERAVTDQDSVRLHDELKRFNANSGYPVSSELEGRELLESEIDKAISESDVMSFRSHVKEVAEEFEPSVKVIPLRTKVNRAIAAAAVIIILTSSGLFMSQRMGTENWIDNSMDKLSEENVGPGAPRGNDDVTDRMIILAYKNYLEEDFQESLDLYDLVERGNIDGPQTWIYQGIANYKTGKFEVAYDYFKKVIEDNDNTHIEKAEWYQIKCLVRQEKRAEAEGKLNRIIVLDQHDYKESATTLLKKLKK